MLSIPAETFTEFGPSKYLRRSALNEIQLADTFSEVRRQLRATCPKIPGVYGMVDCAGRLVYVGMSRSLRNRTLTYFQESGREQTSVRQRDRSRRKETRVALRARRLVWEPTGNELLALLREQELIRRFAPEMNVRGRRHCQLAYVYLSVEDAPRFRIGVRLPQGCRYRWGPVVHDRRLTRAVDALNHHFLLPDCLTSTRMHFGDERNLFELELAPQCLRGQLQRCLAPCAGAISRSEYTSQLRRARAFLNGCDSAPLAEIDARLQREVAQRRYEQAARLRDLRIELETLRDRLLPRTARLPASFVYQFARGGRSCWMAVHESLVLKVAPAPRSSNSAEVWHQRLDNIVNAKVPIIEKREGSELEILDSWFRHHPAELARVLDFDAAFTLCRPARP